MCFRKYIWILFCLLVDASSIPCRYIAVSMHRKLTTLPPTTQTQTDHGRIVVDLVGGWQDPAMTKPYDFGTIHAVHSSGKTVAAITALQAISEGKFDFDDRVASIWKEFGQGNKDKVTVKELLEHSGGVAWWARAGRDRLPRPDLTLLLASGWTPNTHPPPTSH